MQVRTLSAATIASWELEAGPTPIHGVHLGLTLGGTIEPHCHRRGQIMLVTSGVIIVVTEGKSWVVSGSRAMWIPEGVSHHIVASTSANLSNLQVARRIAPRLPRTARALLETAGIDTAGGRGAARVAAMTATWARILQVWRDDEGALNRTMAEIDGRLKSMRSGLGKVKAGF